MKLNFQPELKQIKTEDWCAGVNTPGYLIRDKERREFRGTTMYNVCVRTGHTRVASDWKHTACGEIDYTVSRIFLRYVGIRIYGGVR
jgi:hypothetical protein